MEGHNPTYFIGIDWASEEHAVCVVDRGGAIEDRWTTAHTADGLDGLVRRLGRFDGAPIAIELTSGLLVDTLVEARLTVVPIHPNQLKATRNRYGAAVGKSDPGDAYILADLVRTDGHRFRALEPQSDITRALRVAVRARDDLVATRVQLANQLRSLLERFWPGAARIFSAIDRPVTLAFLNTYPTPDHARRLGVKRLRRFLKRHHYSGRRDPVVLLERLREAPEGLAGPLEREAGGQVVLGLVAALEPVVEQIKDLEGTIAGLLDQHPDGEILQSFPRTGTINAAQILAELGDVRERFLDAEHLAAEAGVAPVTYASGKRTGVAFRYACNKRLRTALTTWANNSRHENPWAADRYQSARGRGHDHPHATRILARSWCRVLFRCWIDQVPYDLSRHAAAQPFLHTEEENAMAA